MKLIYQGPTIAGILIFGFWLMTPPATNPAAALFAAGMVVIGSLFTLFEDLKDV